MPGGFSHSCCWLMTSSSLMSRPCSSEFCSQLCTRHHCLAVAQVPQTQHVQNRIHHCSLTISFFYFCYIPECSHQPPTRKYWLSTYFLTQHLVPYQVHLFGLLKVFLKSLCSSPLIAPEFRLPEFLTASCLIFPPLVLRQNLLLLNQVTEPRSFTWCTASQRWNLEVCSRERVYSQAAKQGDTRINLKLASLKERVRIFMG